MLIHFETKRRWNITISTTRHNLVEDTTGPGASPCTCRDSTFALPVDNAKSSPVPWYPKDPAREDWSSSNSAPILRCRNFLRKIYRFSIRTHRMDHRRYADVTYDEPPPPYECQQREELPALSIHELPDQRMLTPELEGHHGFTELESPVEQTDDYPFNLGSNQMTCPYSSEANEHGATADRIVLQLPTSVEASRLPWSLNTQQHFGSAPSMTSGGQSHQSSPISPVTPDINGDYPTQLHPDANLAAGIVSPLGSIPPYNSSWARPHLVDIGCGYASQTSLPTSLEASPVESFREIVQQSQVQRLDTQQDDYTCSAVPLTSVSHESYIPGNRPLFASGESLLQSHAQWHNTTNIRLGDYELCEHLGWQYCGGYGRDATGDEDAKQTELTVNQPGSSQYANHFDEDLRPLLKYIELHDHQDPEIYMESRADEIDYPLEHCGQCDKTFSGRYRKGNLRRHVLAFHNPLATVVGRACRVCKKAYKRADATRKHEWKKHHILDAKPKKRAK